MARLARCPARSWEQSVSAGSAGHGDSANPTSRECEPTATYYIKTAAADVRTAMATLENHITESVQTKTDTIGTLDPDPIFNRSTVQ